MEAPDWSPSPLLCLQSIGGFMPHKAIVRQTLP